MYDHIKSKLQEAGELMVMSSDGTAFELHLHNVSFDDKAQIIEIDASSETYWLNPNEVIYTWIHREGPGGE